MPDNITETCILYQGMNGYGISCFYLGINILVVFIAVAAALLNGIIIFILFGRDFRDDVSCIFISHLALSDFFSGILLLYNTIYNLIHYKLFYECAVRFGLVNGVFLKSFIALLFLTIDRYSKIVLPYRYANIITARRAKLLMKVSWLICITFCQAPLFGWNQNTSEEFCRYFGVFTKLFLKLISAFMIIITFIILVMYVHILIIAFKQNKRISADRQYEQRKSFRHIWWKPTKTTMILVGIHIISWVPTGAFVALASTERLDHLTLGQKGTLFTYVSAPVFLNCIANPLIYACKIRKVSRVFRRALNMKDVVVFVTDYGNKHHLQNKNNNNRQQSNTSRGLEQLNDQLNI